MIVTRLRPRPAQAAISSHGEPAPAHLGSLGDVLVLHEGTCRFTPGKLQTGPQVLRHAIVMKVTDGSAAGTTWYPESAT